MPKVNRIFYFGMVNTEAYSQLISEPLFVGAASGKMTGVILALRAAGQRAILVSLPNLNKEGSPKLIATKLIHGDGYPAFFFQSSGRLYFAKYGDGIITPFLPSAWSNVTIP